MLLRLRGITLDAARRALADRLREEAAAADRAADVAGTIARETAAQAGQPDFGATSDNYAAWLARTQDARREARQAATEPATAATAGHALPLTDERAAGPRAGGGAGARAGGAPDAAARLEQQAVDEAAAGCKRPQRWSG